MLLCGMDVKSFNSNCRPSGVCCGVSGDGGGMGMRLYDARGQWSRKAGRIYSFIMTVGNFGHNRDLSYYSKYPYFVRKAVSFGRRVGDVFRHVRIFPLESLRFLPRILFVGLRSAARGE